MEQGRGRFSEEQLSAIAPMGFHHFFHRVNTTADEPVGTTR
ncbi:hypothetical protein [Streptomyces sp. enrichment culture]